MSTPRYLAALMVMVLSLALPAVAVEPESGIYWAQGRPGEGLLIERQGDQIGVVLYTFSASGEPEFYVAGGPLEEGGDTEPVGWTEGYFPLNRLTARLLRITDGPRFTSIDFFWVDSEREFETTDVGIIDISFLYGNVVDVFIRRDELPADAHPLQVRLTRSFYQRTNFGFSEFGTDVILAGTYQNPLPCWFDLSGTWSFVGPAAAENDVWRFDFALEEVSPPSEEMTCPVQSGQAHVLVYEDPLKQATMRCVSAPSGDPLDGRNHIPGCEVTREGEEEALFFFYAEDIGLKRMVGSMGPFPARDSGILRRPERVIGLRVD